MSYGSHHARNATAVATRRSVPLPPSRRTATQVSTPQTAAGTRSSTGAVPTHCCHSARAR